MTELACPECYTSLFHGSSCGYCVSYRDELDKEIPNLMPRRLTDTAAYLFEVSRYESIAQAGPENYTGYAESKPEERAAIMKALLEAAGVEEFVNVGPGFGALEDVAGGFKRTALDACRCFLCSIKEKHPDIQCVQGIAERLPFVTGSVPCLVADSVFQSIVDREKFLYEIGRVCSADAKLFLTVAYAWNYPRRPQNDFNVLVPHEKNTLFRFLEELGFSIQFRVMNLAKEEWAYRAGDLDDGDYLYILGER